VLKVPGLSKTPSVHPAINGHSAIFRAGGHYGDEEEEWHPTSIAPFLVQIDSLTATFPQSYWVRDDLYLFYSVHLRCIQELCSQKEKGSYGWYDIRKLLWIDDYKL